MKTEDLVALLAAGDITPPGPAAGRLYATACGRGGLIAILLMLTFLKFRPDLLQALWLPMFWVKIGFAAALAAVGLFAVLRLSRPGARLTWLPLALALPLLAIWALAAISLANALPEERSALFFGKTWLVCPLLIALLSIPVFRMVFLVMREMAPTRPALAGSAAGLLSGAVATLVYCLHCPEMGAPFVGFWYLLGILIPTTVGAIVGNKTLKW